jgi:hypothetical protein
MFGKLSYRALLASGRVTEISYTGDTDIWGAKDAECAPIVRNCLEYRAQR